MPCLFDLVRFRGGEICGTCRPRFSFFTIFNFQTTDTHSCRGLGLSPFTPECRFSGSLRISQERSVSPPAAHRPRDGRFIGGVPSNCQHGISKKSHFFSRCKIARKSAPYLQASVVTALPYSRFRAYRAAGSECRGRAYLSRGGPLSWPVD